MKERPILFNGAMVRAILAGAKTQTRRVITAEWARCLDLDDPDDRTSALEQCPYGKPGDRLWVRETWGGDSLCGYAYRADHPDWLRFHGDGEQPSGPWRPSIHMRREASRLTLEVVSVRVDRLQDISEEDAMAEGIVPMSSGDFPDYSVPIADWERVPDRCVTAVDSFRSLWDSINAKCAPWASNPFVWVIEFRKVESAEAAA